MYIKWYRTLLAGVRLTLDRLFFRSKRENVCQFILIKLNLVKWLSSFRILYFISKEILCKNFSTFRFYPCFSSDRVVIMAVKAKNTSAVPLILQIDGKKCVYNLWYL